MGVFKSNQKIVWKYRIISSQVVWISDANVEKKKGKNIKYFSKSLIGICHHYVYKVLRMFTDHF